MKYGRKDERLEPKVDLIVYILIVELAKTVPTFLSSQYDFSTIRLGLICYFQKHLKLPKVRTKSFTKYSRKIEKSFSTNGINVCTI